MLYEQFHVREKFYVKYLSSFGENIAKNPGQCSFREKQGNKKQNNVNLGPESFASFLLPITTKPTRTTAAGIVIFKVFI